MFLRKNQNHPFLWGAATSSHQVEGNNFSNDWWDWERRGKVRESSGRACDQYRLFREDIALIQSLGHNAHRFSIEWSRIEPEENQTSDEALKHYEDVLKELCARGIEPVVTLHHFTNPQWFTQKGGWLRPDASQFFLRYVDRVVRAFGKYVKYWVTVNEPLIYLYFGYYAGLWPPGRTSYPEALKVFRQLLVAHVESYAAIHGYYEAALKKPVYVSIAAHMTHFAPCRPSSPRDRWAIFLRNWFFNHLFCNAAMSGILFYPGIWCEKLAASRTLDFLGLNYYTRDFIRFSGWFEGNSLGEICGKDHHKEHVRAKNIMGWEIYPEGLYHVLKRLRRYRVPVLVTENGICTEDDEERQRFIRDHVAALARAKREGVPILGYLYWSLLDNFEWAHGFGPRFGIVGVDYKTQERKVRPSAQVLKESCRKLAGGG